MQRTAAVCALVVMLFSSCGGHKTAVTASPGGTTAPIGAPPPSLTVTSTPTAAAVPQQTGGPPPPPSNLPNAPAAPKSVAFTPALGGKTFARPVELGPYPGGRVFVAEQEGLVTLFNLDGSSASALIDIRSQVSRSGTEEGFLSLALDPSFPGLPYVYAYYSVAGGQRRTRLARFEVRGDSMVPGSELVILEQPQPASNHNGGSIRFGPDRMLYLGLGDGGFEQDPNRIGQRLDTWLSKILRIDVRNASSAVPYVVPRDNPFVGQAGVKPETWAYGFRNPWRMSFDPVTNALWVGDVGQDKVEEIDVVQRAANYGWSRFEANDCYNGPCDMAGLTFPVATYTHSLGCSVTGGVVYRGKALPALEGWYLYADYCSGRLWAVPVAGGDAVALLGSGTLHSVTSFGTDASGEVYVLQQGGAVLRLAGAQ